MTMHPVPGLRIVPAYVTSGHQHALLAAVDGAPWREELTRRVQHYGYRYDYKRRSVDRRDHLGALPTWCGDLVDRVVRDVDTARPDQLIVNEYKPGQGISAHVDCIPCFGPVVISISLGSACLINFSEPASKTTIDIVVEPGSLLIMAGDARYVWRHRIAARRSDVINGVRRPRGRRVSLTFRTVNLSAE